MSGTVGIPAVHGREDVNAKALFLTAYNRPDLLDRTMRSWELVRGVTDWPFFVRIEPSPVQEECVRIVRESLMRTGHQHAAVSVNPELYGVLHHPWVGFEHLFQIYEFVVRAEDDLCVSDDILEYFDWASEYYRIDKEVATIHAYSDGPGEDPAVVHVLPTYANPLVWGTWKNYWQSVIGPTWDHSYSTYTDVPGKNSGWDWNLNLRVFPEHGLWGAVPEMSRVDNIGVHGTHSTTENFRTAESFHPHYDRTYVWKPLFP